MKSNKTENHPWSSVSVFVPFDSDTRIRISAYRDLRNPDVKEVTIGVYMTPLCDTSMPIWKWVNVPEEATENLTSVINHWVSYHDACPFDAESITSSSILAVVYLDAPSAVNHDATECHFLQVEPEREDKTTSILIQLLRNLATPILASEPIPSMSSPLGIKSMRIWAPPREPEFPGCVFRLRDVAGKMDVTMKGTCAPGDPHGDATRWEIRDGNGAQCIRDAMRALDLRNLVIAEPGDLPARKDWSVNVDYENGWRQEIQGSNDIPQALTHIMDLTLATY